MWFLNGLLVTRPPLLNLNPTRDAQGHVPLRLQGTIFYFGDAIATNIRYPILIPQMVSWIVLYWWRWSSTSAAGRSSGSSPWSGRQTPACQPRPTPSWWCSRCRDPARGSVRPAPASETGWGPSWDPWMPPEGRRVKCYPILNATHLYPKEKWHTTSSRMWKRMPPTSSTGNWNR